MAHRRLPEQVGRHAVAGEVVQDALDPVQDPLEVALGQGHVHLEEARLRIGVQGRAADVGQALLLAQALVEKAGVADPQQGVDHPPGDQVPPVGDGEAPAQPQEDLFA